MRDVPVWLGLGIWAVTLAGGAALGLGTGLHRGAQIERLRTREPLADQVVAQVLFSDTDDATLRRSLSWLATNHHDAAARTWAATELHVRQEAPWAPAEATLPAQAASAPANPAPPPVAIQRVAAQDLGETVLDLPPAPVPKAAPVVAPAVAAKPAIADAPPQTGPVRVAVVRNYPPPPPPAAALPALPPEQVAAELASRFTAPAAAALAAPTHGQIVPGPVDTWQASGATAAREFVAAHISSWLPCYESALASVPTLSGVLDLTLHVVSGQVAEVHTMTDTVGGPEVAACVTQQVRGWALPAEVNGRIGIPVHLRPAG